MIGVLTPGTQQITLHLVILSSCHLVILSSCHLVILSIIMPDVAVSIVLPTYNERDNILDLIRAIEEELAGLDLGYEILVVDDDSPDGTANLVRETYGLDAAGFAPGEVAVAPRVRLIVRTRDKGLARSIRCGLEAAVGRTLVVMDTDFNHPPHMIPQMVDLLRYYDLVIGSRFVMRGGMEDALRYRLSFLYNVFIRMLLHTQIQDNLSGYFAVRRERLFTLSDRFDRIFYGYGDYFIRLLLLAWRSEWRILEVPVFYILRRHGDSKTGFWRIFRDYTAAVIRLRLFGI
jgi:dolichol-phosphate mannosyltransferase